MDPDGKTDFNAGQLCWPPAGSYMTATGQDLMAADNSVSPGGFDNLATAVVEAASVLLAPAPCQFRVEDIEAAPRAAR